MAILKNRLKKGSRAFFLLRLFYFILLLAAADFSVGKLLGYLYKKQQSGNEFATRYAAEETKADMIIFGASRAQQQYNPLHFQKTLGLSCHNAGREGIPFFYHYAILQAILKRHTPKIILLDCEFWSLKKSSTAYDRLSCLLPLYNTHPEIQPIVNLKSDFEKYKFVSSTYPYNSMMFKIAAGIKHKYNSSEYINGFTPLYKQLTSPVKTYDYTIGYELDSIKISMLKSFIEDCSKRNIRLYFVSPPYYMKTIGTDYSLAITKQIATASHIPFFDYSQDTAYFNKPQLFEDTVHLNYDGSKIFCEALADKLKKEINSTP